MRSFCYIFVFAAVIIAVASAADLGGKARYVGGTIETLSNGTDGTILATGLTGLLFTVKKGTIQVPYQQINLLEYGQKVDRRVAMAIVISPLFILSKSRKHFLTVGFIGPDGQQQAMVFRLEKGNVRSVLASLEARTGIKVIFQDEEARKGGKG
ncbi:MAG: hypothetical protein JJE04_25130 [Acidobacteriia bacterium]|nr:hypothetical protein [Terriglobia bacterium]